MYMQYVTEYDVTNISDPRPRKNMITMGKADTSDLMMIITWAINISFQSPELKWVSWTHTNPYILMKKVIERTNSMLDTPPRDKLYRRLQVFNACEHSWIMMIMGGSKYGYPLFNYLKIRFQQWCTWLYYSCNLEYKYQKVVFNTVRTTASNTQHMHQRKCVNEGVKCDNNNGLLNKVWLPFVVYLTGICYRTDF